MLREFTPSKEFFIDSMLCLIPWKSNIRNVLPRCYQALRATSVSKYAREVWTFANLYPKPGAATDSAVLRAGFVRVRNSGRGVDAKLSCSARMGGTRKQTGNATLDAEVVEQWSRPIKT